MSVCPHCNDAAAQALTAAFRHRIKTLEDESERLLTALTHALAYRRPIEDYERMLALLNDPEYIRMKAYYNRGHLSWANMIEERERGLGPGLATPRKEGA